MPTWYVKAGRYDGSDPVSTEVVVADVLAGHLDFDTPVQSAGDTRWFALGALPELVNAIRRARGLEPLASMPPALPIDPDKRQSLASVRPQATRSTAPVQVAASSLPVSRPPLPVAGQKSPPPRKGFSVSPLAMTLGALTLVGLVVAAGYRWMRHASDGQSLGNTAPQDTTCAAAAHYCLTGGAADEARPKTKWTLIIAWREGCLDDGYRGFLESLAESHRADLTVLGVGMAVPPSSDPRAIGKRALPPPASWPPAGCAPRFETLPTSRGYASDFLALPATYLVDSDGHFIAAWRGGMSPDQRGRLSAWLDGSVWRGP